MVVAGKIFKLLEPMPLPDLASKLSDHKEHERYDEGGYKFSLITEVVNLTSSEADLRGIYSHDYVTSVFHRGKVLPLPKTVEVTFGFSQDSNRTILTVIERKTLANFIANRLGEVIYGKTARVIEARIPPETLKSFHLKNPEHTKITFFDNVDIPNINKLSLYGSDLITTNLFEEYSKHGDLWYIVVRSREHGYIVGLTRDASVTVFNSIDKGKYAEYVRKEIYPLIV